MKYHATALAVVEAERMRTQALRTEVDSFIIGRWFEAWLGVRLAAG